MYSSQSVFVLLLILQSSSVISQSWSIKNLFPYGFRPSTYADVLKKPSENKNIDTIESKNEVVINIASKRRSLLKCKPGQMLDKRGKCRTLW